jgi:hypothetical protein
MTPVPPKRLLPITITRHRVPNIRLIKREAIGISKRDVVMFYAGACAAVFVALLALVIMKLHPWR